MAATGQMCPVRVGRQSSRRSTIASRLTSQPSRDLGVRLPVPEQANRFAGQCILSERWELMADIKYFHKVINGVRVVITPAEIDMTTANQLRAALLLAADSGHQMIVVDMSHTQFCDSAGLHTLIAAHRRAQAEHRELRLVIPADGAVPRIVSLTGIERYIPCFASLEEALSQMPATA